MSCPDPCNEDAAKLSFSPFRLVSASDASFTPRTESSSVPSGKLLFVHCHWSQLKA